MKTNIPSNPLKTIGYSKEYQINQKTFDLGVDTRFKPSIIRPHQDELDSLYVDYI